MNAKIDFSWATNENHPAGAADWNGDPTKVVPSAGEQAAGYQPGERPSPETFNYLLNRLAANARILQAQGRFSGDLFRPLPAGHPIPTDVFFLVEVRDANNPRISRRHWMIDGTNVYRSEDGWNYDAGQAHSVASAINLGYLDNERVFVVGSAVNSGRGTNSVPADQTTLTFSNVFSGGFTGTLRQMVAHYRDGATTKAIGVHDDGGISLWDGGSGYTLTQDDIGTEDIHCVVSANGVLVAAHRTSGDDELLWSDDDGATWDNIDLTNIPSATVGYQIAYCEEPLPNATITGFDAAVGLWVACGDSQLYASIDNGENWTDYSSSVQLYTRGHSTAAPLELGTDFTFLSSARTQSLGTDGQRFYALVDIGSRDFVAYSEDGLIWFLTDVNGATVIYSMLPLGGRGGGYVLILVGSDLLRTDSVRTGISPLTITS